MTRFEHHIQNRLLLIHLRWLTRLRWVAGLAALIGSALNAWWLGWYDPPWAGFVISGAILCYNVVLRYVTYRPGRVATVAVALANILLDLAFLTLLVLWTGGVDSPIRGFFVFHMVFASLLLPRPVAYAAAAFTLALFALGLGTTGAWPDDASERLSLLGWALMLVFTVFLTNCITASLRRHFRRLVKGNQRIRSLAQSLRQHQQSMIQHEKMIAMGQMAAGVAHEIANPLASMDSIAQLVQRQPQRLTPEKLEALRTQVERIKVIVRDLTEFAHPTDYQWKTVQIDELVRECLSVARYDRRFKQAKIEKRLEAGDCTARVQPHKMQQVLTNIMINALDAMAGVADPRLVIASGRNGAECWVSVSDNGQGIAPPAWPGGVHRQRRVRRVLDAARLLQVMPPDGAVLPGLARIDAQRRALRRLPLRAGAAQHLQGQVAGVGAGGQVHHQHLRLQAARRGARQLMPAGRLPRAPRARGQGRLDRQRTSAVSM